jgi:hypothetical protein
LNTSGEGVAILRDNTTNDFTPVVTGTPSNYVFYVTASKVKVPLVFRNSGSLTRAKQPTRKARSSGIKRISTTC